MQKRNVRSFDIFDTLIARKHIDPRKIFQIVEERGIKDFKKIREEAQNASNHTWDDIYEKFRVISGKSVEEIKIIQELEIQAEISSSYLIEENYNHFQDGDILVSDMYLPADVISRILRELGFRKSGNIYVTPNGKYSGSIWPTLKESFHITQHIGDNLHSDVISPQSHSISAQHFTLSHPTAIEKILLNIGAEKIAGLLRKFRLTNPFSPNTLARRIYDIQASSNLPLLVLLSKQINNYCIKENLSRVLFTKRDSCLLHSVFQILYPNTESISFDASRIAYKEKRPAYIEYLKSVYLPKKTMIFDLHGSFKTGKEIFLETFNETPRVHIHSLAGFTPQNNKDITFNIENGSNNTEKLNLDKVGPLISKNSCNESIRAPLIGYPIEIANLYKTTLIVFEDFLTKHRDEIQKELEELTSEIPWNEINHQIEIQIRNFQELTTLKLKEHKSLTQIANENNSDKGNLYKCAHSYTYVYEEVLQEVGKRDHFSLLEIGLNRDSMIKAPSLEIWKEYFGERVSIYGMDIIPDFKNLHKPEKNIHIIIGDQSNPQDLLQCVSENPKGYDVIIDDGYHATKHQLITLKTLWHHLSSGGYYFIEDLHYQPIHEDGLRTHDLIQNWLNGIRPHNQYIQDHEAKKIIDEIASIDFFDSQSKFWPKEKTKGALVLLRKK